MTALFSALLVVVRMFHVPFRMPGLGGVPWLVILLITPAFLSSRLSSTRISFIGGLIASFLLDTPLGPFHLIKYISAGLTIDLLHYILKNRNTHCIKAVIGASSYAVPFTSLATLFILIGINMRILKLVFPYVLALHVAFGALAGFISYLIVNIVEKAKFVNL